MPILALGQRVPYLTGALGMSSSGGELTLSFRDLIVGCGTSANCPIAILYIITSIDFAVDLTISVCVLTVATVGAGAVDVGVEGVGWVSTLTLYLLLAIMIFPSFVHDICFGSWGFPDSGVGAWLGWSQFGLLAYGFVCSWVWGWGLDLGPSLPSSSKYVLIFQMGSGKDRALCCRDCT